ncbi:Gldg family protein [Leptospira sp. 96542]|nr:Gldg family protein [Leptospira sp. 96542]
MSISFSRILPFVSVLTLFVYFLFDGMIIDPKRKIIWNIIVFGFLISDLLYRSITKGFKKEELNRYIGSGFGVFAFFASLLRDFIELKPIAGMNEEVSAIPKIREFLLLLVVLFSLVFLIQTILLEVGKASLEAQSNLSKSKNTLIQNAVLGFLMVLPILVAVNYFAIKRNYNFDMSAQGKFSLSNISKNILKKVDGDVTITAFYPRPLEADGPPNGDKMAAFALTRIRPDIEILLDQISAENPKITVQFINADVEIDLLKDFNQVANGNIFIRAKKEKSIGNVLPYAEERVFAKEPKDLEDLERKLVAAILNVTTPSKKVYFTSANGERYGAGFKALPNEQINRFVASLNFLNFKVSELGLPQGWPSKLPEDADLLVILGPTVPFSETAKAEIKNYLYNKNGKLLITMEPRGSEDFAWLLDSAGISFKKTMLVERDEKPGVIVAKKFPENKLTELIQKKDLGVLFPYSGYFVTKPKTASQESLKYESILETGYEVYSDENGNGKLDGTEKRDNQIVSIVLTKESLASDTSGKIILHSGTSWITDQFIAYVMNSQFSTVSVTGLFLDSIVGEIPPKKEEIQTITLTDNQKLVVWAIGVFLFPGLILSIGSYYVYIRRKKSLAEV